MNNLPEKPRKSTKVIILSRIQIVFDKMMNGWGRMQIVQYGAMHWHVNTRMIDRYIQRARERINLIQDSNIDNSYSFHVAKRLQLLHRCKGITDRNARLKMELEICKDMADIQGLYMDRVEFVDPEKKESELQQAKELAGVEFEVIDGKSEYGT